MMVAEQVRIEPPPSPAPRRSPRRRLRLHPVAAVSYAGMLLLGACLLYVSQRAELAELGYRLQRAEQQYAELVRTRDRLIFERAQAGSLARIEQVARGRLGMVRPERFEVVVVAPPARPEAVSVAQRDDDGIGEHTEVAGGWLDWIWPWVSTAHAKGTAGP